MTNSIQKYYFTLAVQLETFMPVLLQNEAGNLHQFMIQDDQLWTQPGLVAVLRIRSREFKKNLSHIIYCVKTGILHLSLCNSHTIFPLLQKHGRMIW